MGGPYISTIHGLGGVQIFWGSEYHVTVHTYPCAAPGVVRDLVCASTVSRSVLSFSWGLPTLFGSEVVSYQVIVNRLEHRPSTRDVILASVYNEFIKTRGASVSGLGKDILMKSECAS